MPPSLPGKEPLTIVEQADYTLSSEHRTIVVELHVLAKGLRVVGRRRIVDDNENFFDSGELSRADDLWIALNDAASEGGVSLPSKEMVVRQLEAVESKWAEALAALSENEDYQDESKGYKCPFCGELGQQCSQHLLLNVDVTFGEAWGPGAELFRKYVAEGEESDDELEASTRERIDKFVEACDKCCDYCFGQDHEGGPGMSSHEYWCWSEDIARDLKRLRRELKLPD